MIYFVRHGQSWANIDTNVCMNEDKDIPLTDLGFEQAKEIANALPIVKNVVCSPFLRTIDTSRPYLEKTKITPVFTECHEFSYLDKNLCKNTSRDDRKIMRHDFWAKNDPFLRHGESESFAEFMQRVTNCIEMLKTYKEDVIVFSHSMFIKGVIIEILFKASLNLKEWHKVFGIMPSIPNCSITQVCLDKMYVSQPETKHLTIVSQ